MQNAILSEKISEIDDKETENYLFSVIVPFYNAEEYIAETVKNLLSAVNGKTQIIFVDDGSTDGSLFKVEKLTETYSACKIITLPHSGVSAARNAGVAASDGEYVTFCDSDDALEKSAFEILERNIREFKPDILVFGARIYNFDSAFTLDDIEPRNIFYRRFQSEILFDERGSRPHVWNCAYRKEFLSANGLKFDENITLGEDQTFQFAAFPKAEKVQFISDKLYRYNYLKYDGAMKEALYDVTLRTGKHIRMISTVTKNFCKTATAEADYLKLLEWILQTTFCDFLALDKVNHKKVSADLKNVLKSNGLNKRVKKLPLKKRIKFFLLFHYRFLKIFGFLRFGGNF